MTERLLRECVHHISSGSSSSLLVPLLDAVAEGIMSLSDRRRRLLPIVHDLWSSLRSCLTLSPSSSSSSNPFSSMGSRLGYSGERAAAGGSEGLSLSIAAPSWSSSSLSLITDPNQNNTQLVGSGEGAGGMGRREGGDRDAVAAACMYVVATMAECAGDFIRDKVEKDILPFVQHRLPYLAKQNLKVLHYPLLYLSLSDFCFFFYRSPHLFYLFSLLFFSFFSIEWFQNLRTFLFPLLDMFPFISYLRSTRRCVQSGITIILPPPPPHLSLPLSSPLLPLLIHTLPTASRARTSYKRIFCSR